ncbi:hypothetical protein BE04_25970 [Sorangium cellulosum]|uniref:Uncharacterized protein n=1 Tax=Sorangium cellulosum TaxID=56 RepID=A0A150PX19_SORCE|nr:hypothetical protein BE04_25970 [Sorangium cellulosum]
MGVVMRRLTAAEVHARKIAELGLAPEALDLTTPEGLAGALRRAASFLCPCSAATLVRAVVRPLRGLVPDLSAAQELVEETLEAMVAHGDVLEQRDVGGHEVAPRVLLYAAPASFVARQSGMVVLLGIASDHLSPLPDELERRIEYVGHVRRLRPTGGEDLGTELRQLGLLELSHDAWLKAPPPETAAAHVAARDRDLDRAAPSREIPGLLLLDRERPVRYYRGRWVAPKSHTGRYVARRSQAYGADLWCYVELQDGRPERMIDLPSRASRWRGCDEAWRLQMAVDARRGAPQCFRVSGGPGGAAVLELFSPVPAWARRRWDAVGEPVASSGCLFAYRISATEIDEERRFARDALWLEEIGASTR